MQLFSLFIIRLAERRGLAGDEVSLAMRVLACKWNELPNEVDRERLRSLQMEDGGWAAGEAYYYSFSGLEVGNRGLTTALAVQALEEPDLRAPSPEPEEYRSRSAATGPWVKVYDYCDGYKGLLVSYATSLLRATLVSLALIVNALGSFGKVYTEV